MAVHIGGKGVAGLVGHYFHIVREDDASLIPWIDKNGFETFEREAAEQRAQAEAAAAEQQA